MAKVLEIERFLLEALEEIAVRLQQHQGDSNGGARGSQFDFGFRLTHEGPHSVLQERARASRRAA